MPQLTPQQAFSQFVVPAAIDYCIQLWNDHHFDFRITKSRASKLGDYRYDYVKKKHTISINHDLNKYGFLITYIHEIAHLKTFKKHGNKVLPHGKEWKSEFKLLMSPVLNSEIFPESIFSALSHYMQNPKASSCSDHNLLEAVRRFDEKRQEISLVEISIGEKFSFNKRVFIKEALKRTRYVCKEERTGRRYLIPKIALVKKVP